MAKIGGITGEEPVAMIALPKASFPSEPSGLFSSSVLGIEKAAAGLHELDAAELAQLADAAGQLFDDRRFERTAAGRDRSSAWRR